VVTDLIQIRNLAEAEADENLHFRRYLKAHHYREGLFRRIAKEVEEQIDCKVCANCCRYTRVNISREDIERLARYLDILPEQVVRNYAIPDLEDRENMLRHTKDGCVFLDGNLCMVYEARPRACRKFPYLTTHERSLGARMSSICKRAWFCPIVYNSLAAYKKLVGYHHSLH